MSKYVSLHNHTSFSIGQALTSPKELFKKSKELGFKAVGVADTDTMAGIWDCLKQSKETGVKLVVGCEFNFVPDISNSENVRLTKIVLIAKNHIGYKNILNMRRVGFNNMTVAFKKVHSKIDWKILEKNSEGLICLTADGNGYIPQLIMDDKLEKAKSEIVRFQKLFGDDFALELQPHNLQIKENPYSGSVDQRKINISLKRFHDEIGAPCIVATGSYYLEKEHHDSHDALLAISSGQPIYSGQRLKFDKRDFYIKSEDEVRAYFSRHKKTWPQEFVDSMIDYTEFLANRCEEPEWIDLKFSNPSGKELPEFPIKDQDDYKDFLNWKEAATSVFFDASLPDDALYYRYSSEKGLEEKISLGRIPKEDIESCHEQMKEEFNVFEYRGFSSYMAMVAAFIKWCKKNDIPVGPGRGCTVSNTKVLTPSGYQEFSKLKGGDYILTHTGSPKKIVCRFNNGMSNNLFSIKTDRSFGVQKFTGNHRVLASKDCKEEPLWIPVSELDTSWYLYSPWPKREVVDNNTIDFYNFCKKSSGSSRYSLRNDEIVVQDRCVVSNLSMRNIARELNIGYIHVYNFKNGKGTSYEDQIASFINKNKISVSEWKSKEHTYIIPRFIESSDFYYLIGRWVGDGSFHNKDKGIVISFNASDIDGINKTKDILVKYFGKVYENKKHGQKDGVSNCVSLTCASNAVYLLFKDLFPDYTDSSTKHFPYFFRSLDSECLRSMILGYFDADGSIHQNYSFKFKSVSLKLTEQLREALLFNKIYSSVYTEESPIRKGVVTKTSYSTIGPLNMFKENILGSGSYNAKRIIDSGYYCKVRDISQVEDEATFDVKVADEPSYCTGNYAVHNSVGGSLTAYLNGIHEAYPKKYDLIFARFLNKFKDAYPDCDVDFSPAGRSKLHDHLRTKYGKEYVAHVSNVNTITPKVYARDISRVFEFGDNGRSEAAEIGNDIADSISSEYSRVTTALKQAPLFKEYAKEYPELEKHAILGGHGRAWSTHAAGLIIGKRPLHEIVPIRRDANGAVCLEYDKERAEENGLVKMDTLGLETLDIIKRTHSIVREMGKTPPSLPFDYDHYDEKTYDLISNGDTFCVFQLTGVAAPVCKMLKPRSIDDIALVTALIRPAAKDIINDFMKVRSGEKELKLMHPTLERALKPTYGFGLYEECLMFIASDVAGWDLHEADGLRKMTKNKGKYPEKVEKLRESFIIDAQKNKNVSEEDATKIWDEVIAGFGGYGFNRCLHFLEPINIYTSEGKFLEEKKIQDVQPGEFVKSRDEKTKEDIYVQVINNHDHGEVDIVEVELKSGERVKCSMNHKFRVQETGEMLPLKDIIKLDYSIVLN